MKEELFQKIVQTLLLHCEYSLDMTHTNIYSVDSAHIILEYMHTVYFVDWLFIILLLVSHEVVDCWVSTNRLAVFRIGKLGSSPALTLEYRPKSG